MGLQSGLFVGDGDVEAEIVFNTRTFLIVPAMQTTRQPGFCRVDRRCCRWRQRRRRREGFTGLRLAIRGAEIAVRAVDAEKVQEIGVARGKGCWEVYEGTLPRRQGDRIPGAVRPENLSPF